MVGYLSVIIVLLCLGVYNPHFELVTTNPTASNYLFTPFFVLCPVLTPDHIYILPPIPRTPLISMYNHASQYFSNHNSP